MERIEYDKPITLPTLENKNAHASITSLMEPNLKDSIDTSLPRRNMNAAPKVSSYESVEHSQVWSKKQSFRAGL